VRAKSVFPYLLLIAAVVEGTASAQSGDGYLSAGVGSRSGGSTGEFAAGGELVIASTVGIGAELGFFSEHGSFGFLNVNGSLHLLRHAAKGRTDPFITGGYTRASDLLASGNGANFGVGLNYWLTHHFGIRAEFRDMLFSSGLPSTVNYWAIRGGISFR
jgi:hypothetical protein